jgi:hypothetical protein
MKEDIMGVSCSTYGGDVNTGISWRKLRKIRLGRPRKIILKFIFIK